MTIAEQFQQLEGTFEVDIKTTHFFSDGVYAKRMHLPKGFTALSHKHTYEHLSILATGKALVATDTEQKEYTAPACITIAAGLNHAITALEDVTWFCIHATEETDPTKVDQVLIGE